MVAKGFINSSLKACLYYWFGARVGLSFYHKEMWGVISVRKYSSQPLSPASRDSPQKFHFLNKRWRYPLHQERLQLSRLITILSLLNPLLQFSQFSSVIVSTTLLYKVHDEFNPHAVGIWDFKWFNFNKPKLATF